MEPDGVLGTDLLAAVAADAAIVVEGELRRLELDRLCRTDLGALAAAGALPLLLDRLGDEESLGEPTEHAGKHAQGVEARDLEIPHLERLDRIAAEADPAHLGLAYSPGLGCTVEREGPKRNPEELTDAHIQGHRIHCRGDEVHPARPPVGGAVPLHGPDSVQDG